MLLIELGSPSQIALHLRFPMLWHAVETGTNLSGASCGQAALYIGSADWFVVILHRFTSIQGRWACQPLYLENQC